MLYDQEMFPDIINTIIDIISRRGDDEVFLDDLKMTIEKRFPPNKNKQFDRALESFALALRDLL